MQPNTPKALVTSAEKVSQWLNAQLVDRPQPADHEIYQTRLTGRAGRSSVRENLEAIIFTHNWTSRTEKALDELGEYFSFTKGWWVEHAKESLPLNQLAASLADAWIYFCWLEEKRPEWASGFLTFFKASFTHPEWRQALEAMRPHYPLVGGNLWETIPRPHKLIYPDCLKKSPWLPSYRQKVGKELIRRCCLASEWLQKLFITPVADRPQLLESGLSHISLAAIKGDSDFFIGLGKALSENFDPPRRLSIEDLRNLPTSRWHRGQTIKQWCRRLWISRGLWLLPRHILEFQPFLLKPERISELTGPRYSGQERNLKNDGLYRSNSLWFIELQDGTASLRLTAEGKKMLPEFADHGLPIKFLLADMV